MVWFQCEDCGESLKKPKLPPHFRICAATKLSCIDCGEVFGQQSVQSHTQCITEAEKYGPKGEKKVANAKPAKPVKENQKPDFDVYVGLSERPPWFCSLCNSQATSKQTLLGHAEGKKHRGKARAFHAANQPKPVEEPAQTNDDSKDKTNGKELLQHDRHMGDKKGEHKNSPAEEGNTATDKKRKLDAAKDDANCKSSVLDNSVNFGNGKVVENKGEVEKTAKKAKTNGHQEHDEAKSAKLHSKKEDELVLSVSTNGDLAKNVKLKKLIKSTLKSNPNGALKMKKLQKLVLQSLEESGIPMDANDLKNSVEKKVNSSSKFEVDGKYVRLAAKGKC
ncbi:UBP1-associated proteins 1C-like protein [Drosera capensis]